ncbi:hypothetical protein AMECASPLE_004248 [Ameca splendens]|uniref:Uncharacterized protein n=1 Tax=Ameca splendens TaxID=208324 RepID=A0ABV0YX30_9TELE
MTFLTAAYVKHLGPDHKRAFSLCFQDAASESRVPTNCHELLLPSNLPSFLKTPSHRLKWINCRLCCSSYALRCSCTVYLCHFLANWFVDTESKGLNCGCAARVAAGPEKSVKQKVHNNACRIAGLL